MFMLFEYMFPIIFVIVFGMIIFQFVTGIRTWHKNNQSPRLSVSATIVAKREPVWSSWLSFDFKYQLLCHVSGRER